ncbi:hypothetical protein C0Q70_03674 [Pomacea canaliculata]|uniref:Uncharacterized protein n=1 Tax=Pomacea canaliculata TaxID=400727 RepID=A0A2T7PTD9_POMCA|nr:hypothetical protein C0Q70_03674 [Pomacea canaliculata]
MSLWLVEVLKSNVILPTHTLAWQQSWYLLTRDCLKLPVSQEVKPGRQWVAGMGRPCIVLSNIFRQSKP